VETANAITDRPIAIVVIAHAFGIIAIAIDTDSLRLRRSAPAIEKDACINGAIANTTGWFSKVTALGANASRVIATTIPSLPIAISRSAKA
jgi:hypothetical protein